MGYDTSGPPGVLNFKIVTKHLPLLLLYYFLYCFLCVVLHSRILACYVLEEYPETVIWPLWLSFSTESSGCVFSCLDPGGPKTAGLRWEAASPFSLGTSGLVQLPHLKGQNPRGKHTQPHDTQRKRPLPREKHGLEPGKEKGRQEKRRLLRPA